jgi:predicted secreted protein
MAKQSGLGWTTFSVATSAAVPTDIRGDTTKLDFATPKETQDVTGLDKYGMERLLLLVDFTVDPEGVFNPTGSHLVFKDVSTDDTQRAVAIVISGQTLSGNCILTDYALSRTNKGEFTWKVPIVLADGVPAEWS